MRTIRRIVKINQPEVNPDCGRQVLFRLDVKRKPDRETGKSLVSLFGDGQGFDFSVSRCFSMMDKLYLADFRHGDPGRRRCFILRIGDAIPLAALSEFRVSRSFSGFDPSKEGLKSFVEALKHVLKHLRMNAFIPWTFDFKSRKLNSLIMIRNRLLFFLIAFLSFVQSLVIQMPAHRKLVLQIRYLGLGWVDAVFERFSCNYDHFLPWFSTYCFTSKNR